tara:strand:- start:1780 stop:2829 length:1050 start_codon:yes stop_codon:yes gene_type:complete
MRIGVITKEFSRGGYGNTTLDIRKVLTKHGHNVCIFSVNFHGRNQKEFSVVSNVEYYSAPEVPPDIFKFWIKKNSLDRVIFLGFDSKEDLLKIGLLHIEHPAHKPFVQLIVIPMWENIVNVGDYNIFSKIICPTQKCYSFFKDFSKAVYVKWGFDEEIYRPVKQDSFSPLKLFHPVGNYTKEDLSGKVAALRGFTKENRIKVNNDGSLEPTSMLYVHTRSNAEPVNWNLSNIIIGEQDLSRDQLAALYQTAHVALLPSKVEGIGLSFLEAIGCGLPIITVNKAPMNEYVDHYLNGFICSYNNFLYDINKAINLFEDKTWYNTIRENVLKTRLDWSWKANGPDLVKAITE